MVSMVTGAHVLLNSSDAEADRAFFRDVLGFPWVDAGHSWLIFKLPPAEAALHPSDNGNGLPGASLYLMCDDLQAEIRSLAAKGVMCSPIDQAPWGSKTSSRCREAVRLDCTQPTHPTALDL